MDYIAAAIFLEILMLSLCCVPMNFLNEMNCFRTKMNCRIATVIMLPFFFEKYCCCHYCCRRHVCEPGEREPDSLA